MRTPSIRLQIVTASAALALLVALVPWSPSDGLAQERPEGEATSASAESALCRAVAKTTVDLAQRIGGAGTNYRTPLRAAFALDRNGKLGLTLLLVSSPATRTGTKGMPTAEKRARAGFEEWTGPVYDASWVPRRRVVTDAATIAVAQRLQTLLASGKVSLWAAAKHAEGVKNERGGTSRRVLAIEPDRRGEIATFTSNVDVGGQVHRLVQSRTTRNTLSFGPIAEPQPRADPWRPLALPELTVKDGTWHGTSKPVTLKSLIGAPALIAITDPG